MTLVPLFRFEVPNRVCGRCCRNFKSAALLGRSEIVRCMVVILITPPGPSTRTGNSVAALRWAHILRQLGHRVIVGADYADEPADMMIAIHAWRSAGAIHRFKIR